MQTFQTLHHWLQENQAAVLLYVLYSVGSSPGRQGFQMAVNIQGEMIGSIGGGIMEHKLVELAKQMLQNGATDIVFKRQIHSKAVAKNQSGMICSGEQHLVLIPLTGNRKQVIKDLVKNQEQAAFGSLSIRPNEFSFQTKPLEKPFVYTYQTDTDWQFQEQIGFKKQAYIIGGGHVGRAVSQVLAMLDFHITIIDNRPKLNTLEENPFAHQKEIIAYNEIADFIPDGKEIYILIMTFGYRMDLTVLQQLIHKKVAYIGMMGSQAKIKQLLAEMRNLGYSEAALAKVHTPIGLPINSRTPEEIAVSVAAQLIQIQNKDLL